MEGFPTQVLSIDGMHSEECVHRISHELGGLPGVRVHNVSLGEARVLAQSASQQAIHDAVERAGFSLSGTREEL